MMACSTRMGSTLSKSLVIFASIKLLKGGLMAKKNQETPPTIILVRRPAGFFTCSRSMPIIPDNMVAIRMLSNMNSWLSGVSIFNCHVIVNIMIKQCSPDVHQ